MSDNMEAKPYGKLTVDLVARRLIPLFPWLGAGLVIAAGAAMRVHVLPAVPLLEFDTRGWLEPAMSWAGGGEFIESCEREWLYAAFLAVCLRVFGSFESIVWLQMAGGLIGAACLFAAWQRWTSLLPCSVTTRLVAGGGGLFVLAAYVLNPNLIAFEMAVRPESLLITSGMAIALCLSAYSSERLTQGASWNSVFWGLPIPLLGGMIATFKPSWALAIPVFGLPLLMGAFGHSGTWATRSLPLLGGCLLAILLVVLPEKLLFKKSGDTRLVFPMTLLTIHADAVVSAMEKRLADGTYPEGERDIISSALPVLREDLAKARENPFNYRRLGFDPDYIMYRASIFPFLEGRHGYSRVQLAAFCNQGYLDAWKYEPGLMIGKILTQLAFIAYPDARTYSKNRVNLQSLRQHSLELAPETAGPQYGGSVPALWTEYRSRLVEASARPAEIRSWKPLDQFLRNRMPIALGMVLLTIGFASLSWVASTLYPLRYAGLLALLYAAIPFGNALTVAIVHSLDNDRYRMTYGPFVVLALTASAVLVYAGIELLIYNVISRFDKKSNTATLPSSTT
ncbi:MAG: hypothetical protein Fur0032_16940 [Terrimicrobiaceae bacterium]